MGKHQALGAAIKRAREAKKLSQDQLAERVGAKGGRFTVIRWEQGLHKPTEYAGRLAAELGLDESVFSDDDDEEEAASMSLTRDLYAVIDAIVNARLSKERA